MGPNPTLNQACNSLRRQGLNSFRGGNRQLRHAGWLHVHRIAEAFRRHYGQLVIALGDDNSASALQ
jgi:hypothetical protein